MINYLNTIFNKLKIVICLQSQKYFNNDMDTTVRETVVYFTPCFNYDEFIQDFDSLKNIYNLRNPEQIQEYLMSNYFIIPTLKECPNHIKDYFPHEELFLEILYDLSDNENSLMIYIATDRNVEEATERLESFDKEWWLDNSFEILGDLLIDVEFK